MPLSCLSFRHGQEVQVQSCPVKEVQSLCQTATPGHRVGGSRPDEREFEAHTCLPLQLPNLEAAYLVPPSSIQTPNCQTTQ
jgi:hypothetical protein